MPKYLIEASYTLEGSRAIMKSGGTARREAVQRAVESVGGQPPGAAFGASIPRTARADTVSPAPVRVTDRYRSARPPRPLSAEC